MAQNLFVDSDYDAIIHRIRSLKPANRRKWGKMSLTQMLEHCAIQLKLGLGIIKQTNPEGLFVMRTSFGRWLILYAIPWPPGLSTPTKMNMLSNDVATNDFDSEKHQLLELLTKVQETERLQPHPFLGALQRRDWGRLIWKHLDHHLRQFSA